MSKSLFTAECEINASPKTLFPYIFVPSLLKKWFADDILIENEESDIVTFVWDGISYPAKIAAKKDAQYVKYEFLDDDEEEISWLQFRIEVNQLTNSTYLIIEDFSEIDNEKDFEEMYNNNFAVLKELVGGNI
jgi:uncharacterized protein YndB with AHSA1/START domain